ncbi:hypothetical protein BDV19DRAFT_381496 [Aspergillus venezuelensis]
MQRAIEQAGSVFTGWISSCLSCLDSSGNDERVRHQQALKDRGAEREMQICHSQPHLVPPMKLVVYDDLPSPGPPRASSFPTWFMEEGRNLASRASSRASMSFKRKSTAPVRISAPTDFRRVTTLPPIITTKASTEYRPLELSIHSPAQRLSDLPRFSDFGVEESQPQQAPITPPPRAMSTMTDFSYPIRRHTHRPSSSFNLPRKPVGSGSRRSSLATLDLLTEKQVPVAHPLIPHFSVRSSTASIATGLASTAIPSRHWPEPVSSYPPRRESHDVTASTIHTIPKPQALAPQEKCLPPVPVKVPRPSYEPPSTPVNTIHPEPFANPSPSRSSRVTQWLLQQSTIPRTPASTRPSSPRKPSLSLSDKLSMRIRSRTLSGSTLAGSINNNVTPTPTGFKAPASAPAPSTPPTTTATSMTARTSTLDSRLALEKDLEASYPYPSYPFAPRQTQSSFLSDENARSHPTIHETQQQSQLSPNHHHRYDYYAFGQHHDPHRHSAIGVAF